MPGWKTAPQRDSYDASAVKILPLLENQEMTARITTVRPECGYSATIYDASVVKLPKTLRYQIGEKYDAKKVRNIHARRGIPYPWSVHVRGRVRAVTVRIQAVSANYPCPCPVRIRAKVHSASA